MLINTYMSNNDGMEKLERFALVDNDKQIYRGSQPNKLHIQLLKSMGIKTIINLRKEEPIQRIKERRRCEKHGIKYIGFPFFGIYGFDEKFVNSVVDAMYNTNEPIYIHCLHGRDRTSVMCASYLVKYHKKDPESAWKEDVLEYDHDETDKYNAKFKESFFEFCRSLNQMGFDQVRHE